MPAVSQTGQLAVIGHLPARLEPGSWASPGHSSSTETQPKPPGQATLRQQANHRPRRATREKAPHRRLGARGAHAKQVVGAAPIT
jgi:hypothetical protein